MEVCQYAHSHPLKRVHQIVDEVPPIGHLHGIGSTAPRRAGIDTVAITADDLHARVFAQPADQCGGGIFQQVDDVVSPCIDQDRAVASSATEGELVDTEDLWRLNRRVWECSYQANTVMRLVGLF
jgi:hypothetical protein